MSIAGDRLTATDRQTIAESLLTDPKPYKSDEVGGHCPFHREETPGGAFFYNFEIDAAHCHSCGQDSDLVGIYNAVHGRPADDSEGCAEFVKKYCPQDGSRPVLQGERRAKPRREWQPGSIDLPPELWREKALAFVEHSEERLQSSPERLAELAAWGIDAETARLCRFGWNDRDKWPPLTAWGLPREMNDKGKEKKVWLPEGLVMPAIRDGQILKLKIRRPNPATPWGTDRKYWEVKGGANRLYHVYGAASYRVWVVTETERDAALVWSRCRGLGIGAMGNGGASKRPAGFVADLLSRAWVILNAMDFDRAGANNTYGFWEKEYPTSVRYPAPPSMGKDVGEAVERGLDVHQWVLDGLPGFVLRKLSASAESSVSLRQEKSESHPPSAPQKSHWEQVLEWMEPWPQWRQVLINFHSAMQENGFRVFRKKDGTLTLGLDDNDWPSLHADEARCGLFCDLRQCFHRRQELDSELGLNSLENIIGHYFKEQLEVRG